MLVPPTTRRQMLRACVLAASAMAFPTIVPASALGAAAKPAPSERITLGVIGLGVQGSGLIAPFSHEGQIVALCDCNRRNLERASARIKGVKAHHDFRELIGRKDVDAVVIATPQHWHAVMSIYAMKQGKDVYCEKPLSLTIREGRAMVETARRHGRVCSGGSQRVRGDYGRIADHVASGAIGTIREIFVNCGGPSRDYWLPAQPVPEWLDWDMWVGPAPQQPFHAAKIGNRTSRVDGIRWVDMDDFSGGELSNWGSHNFGGAMYAAQLEETGPVEILPPGSGARYLTFRFANGIRMYHGGAGQGNISFAGDKGTASAGQQFPAVRNSPLRQYRGNSIGADFINCVRTRRRPFQDVEYAHRVATVCLLGKICYDLKRPLKWDPAKEVFPEDGVANRLLDRAKREPWSI